MRPQIVLHGFPAISVQAVQSFVRAGNLPGFAQFALAC